VLCILPIVGCAHLAPSSLGPRIDHTHANALRVLTIEPADAASDTPMLYTPLLLAPEDVPERVSMRSTVAFGTVSYFRLR
jgi:hypothetical protein